MNKGTVTGKLAVSLSRRSVATSRNQQPERRSGRKEGTAKAILLILSALVLAGAPACSDSGGAPSLSDRAASVNENLTLGSKGDAVREVTQSLTASGYFPNPELAGTFPAWRPVVPVAPADASIFDDRTAQAVLEFQGRNGLPATGIADQAMRTLLKQRGCGNPDSARFDPTDKFARWVDIGGCSKWNISSVNYFVASAAPGVSKANTQAAADAAAFTWNTAANELLVAGGGHVPGTIFLNSSSSSINITIEAAPVTGPYAAVTVPRPCSANGNPTSVVININNSLTFSVANPTPAGANDLQGVILHELGHALGLQHSFDSNAIMHSSFKTAQQRTLDDDDSWGLASLYAQARHVNNTWPLAVDIGASHEGGGSRFPWAIDANGAIYQFNGLNWDKDTTGSSAYAISVAAQSEPFIVSYDAGIYFKPSASATSGLPWSLWAPGPTNDTYDIGVGGDGFSIWILADPLAANGQDASVYQWTPSGWVQDAQGMTGYKIAVNDEGIPYITTYSGQVWRKPLGLAWQPILNPDPVGAIDIGISNSNSHGLNNYAWIAGSDGNVYMFQEQDATDGAPVTPAFLKWDRAPFSVPGGAYALDVDGAGFAWVVANGGKIYQVVP